VARRARRRDEERVAGAAPAQAVLLAQLRRQQADVREHERTGRRSERRRQRRFEDRPRNLDGVRTDAQLGIQHSPLVCPEVGERRRVDLGRCTEDGRHDLHLVVEPFRKLGSNPADVRLVHREAGIHERRMHPQHQLGIRSGIRRAAAPAVDARMHGLHHRAHTVGVRARAEDDRVQRGHRPRQAPPGVVAVARVVDDPGRDEWMRRLHQQRTAAAEHQNRLTADAADRAIGSEIAVLAHNGPRRKRLEPPRGCGRGRRRGRSRGSRGRSRSTRRRFIASPRPPRSV
jgi:hypothetical protein